MVNTIDDKLNDTKWKVVAKALPHVEASELNEAHIIANRAKYESAAMIYVNTDGAKDTKSIKQLREDMTDIINFYNPKQLWGITFEDNKPVAVEYVRGTQECYWRDGATAQRATELSRNEGLGGTEHYNTRGCFDCNGLNKACEQHPEYNIEDDSK